MKKFRFLLVIILIVTVCCSCLVACDFNSSQGTGNNNESNIEQDNGEIITPSDKEDGTQTEIPSEPEPEPPVDPEEPEKPVEPTPDEKFEIPEKYNKLLSDWEETEVGYLIDGFTKLYGKEFLTEEKGILSIAVNVELSGLEIDEGSKSIRALIKYNLPEDSKDLVKYAEKTMQISSDINIFEHIKEIAAYEELVGFPKDGNNTTQSNFTQRKFVPPENQEFTMTKTINYINIPLYRENELDKSRMDDMKNVLNSFNKFDNVKQVFYATNLQSGGTGNMGENETRWSTSALVLNNEGQLQLIELNMALSAKLIYNTPHMILDFENWQKEGLVEGKDFEFRKCTITSEKTFGGVNAVFIIDLYEN